MSAPFAQKLREVAKDRSLPLLHEMPKKKSMINKLYLYFVYILIFFLHFNNLKTTKVLGREIYIHFFFCVFYILMKYLKAN